MGKGRLNPSLPLFRLIGKTHLADSLSHALALSLSGVRALALSLSISRPTHCGGTTSESTLQECVVMLRAGEGEGMRDCVV